MNKEASKINKLIYKISQNDSKALEDLFALTKEKMRYLASKYLNDKTLVDDVLSISYYKIYKNADKFDKKLNGFNWMHEIVKNSAIDQNKLESKHNNENLDENTYCEQSTFENKNLEIAMKALPELEYKIVRLKIWENLTLKEIALELNMSISKVHRIYTNALNQLKESMKVLERGTDDEK